MPEPSKPTQAIKFEIDDAKQKVVLSGTAEKLTEDDIDKLIFLKNDNTSVSGSTVNSIKADINFRNSDRAIVIPLTTLRSNGVAKIKHRKYDCNKCEVPTS